MKTTRQHLAKFFPEDFDFSLIRVIGNCPYTENELRTGGQKSDIAFWRSIYMCFRWMNGETHREAAASIGKEHSMAVKAAKDILKHMQQLRFDGMEKAHTKKWRKEILVKVVYGQAPYVVTSSSVCQDELVSLQILQNNLIFKKIQ